MLRRALAQNGRDFVGYIDALGWVDGIHCVIEWKTSTLSYPESSPRVLELDPLQLGHRLARRQVEIELSR